MASTLVIRLSVGWLLSAALVGQSLDLSFIDHDGTTYAGCTFPALRTGSFQGTLAVPNGPELLEHVWAFYVNGQLCYSQRTAPAYTFHYVFRPEPDNYLIESKVTPGTYGVSLPYGEAAFCQLTIGTSYTLRMWVGQPNAMTFNGVTGEPVAGYLATCTAPVEVQSVPYAIHTFDPRNQVCGHVAEMRIVTVDPVVSDTYFEVFCDGPIGQLSTTQTLIPAGNTCSGLFALQLSDYPAEGSVWAIGDDGEARSSAVLRCQRPGEYVDENAGPSTVSEEYPNAFCKHRGRPISFGSGGEYCGPCPLAEVPGMCGAPPGLKRAKGESPECGVTTSSTRCEVFTETMTMYFYGAGPTYEKPCGEVNVKDQDATIELGVRVPPASGKIGAGGGATETKHILFKICCKLTYSHASPKDRLQCRTLN